MSVFGGIFKNKKSAALLAAALVLLIVGFAFDGSGNNNTEEKSDGGISAREYTESTEKKLEKLLSELEGVGEVKVMISLESRYENVYLKGSTQNEKQSDSGREIVIEEEYITVKKGSSTEEGLLVKVYEPKIKGVAVVAQGADSATVKKAITDTVCAVFSISSARVSVENMSAQK